MIPIDATISLPMHDSTLRALLTWDAPERLLEPLFRIGVRVDRLPEDDRTELGLRAAIGNYHALLCAPPLPVTERVLDAAECLRVVSTWSVGYDPIDVPACRARGIAVGHTPGVVVEATADIAFALVLAVMRGIICGDRFVRSGAWATTNPTYGTDLRAKTLGIIGMGAIGTAVARRAIASGMQIVYANRTPRIDAPPGATLLTLDALLERADTVVLLAPATAQTRKMMNAPAFARMQPGAFFVNASRGSLVDTQALHAALASGQLGGAAVDVLDPEPIGADHPLLALPNFFITPHIGTATKETRRAMAELCIANAVAGLRGEPLPAAVPDTTG